MVLGGRLLLTHMYMCSNKAACHRPEAVSAACGSAVAACHTSPYYCSCRLLLSCHRHPATPAAVLLTSPLQSLRCMMSRSTALLQTAG